MIDKIKDNIELILISAALIVMIVILVIASVMSARDQAAWEAWCVDQGGHVTEDSNTSVGTGYDTKGKPVTTTTTTTTYYCLTTDGRIIDIN
jgi:hypothetical protein